MLIVLSVYVSPCTLFLAAAGGFHVEKKPEGKGKAHKKIREKKGLAGAHWNLGMRLVLVFNGLRYGLLVVSRIFESSPDEIINACHSLDFRSCRRE